MPQRGQVHRNEVRRPFGQRYGVLGTMRDRPARQNLSRPTELSTESGEKEFNGSNQTFEVALLGEDVILELN